MVIAAAAQRRDMLAWQIARGVRDKDVRSFADLRGDGKAAAPVSQGGIDAQNQHSFRLWKRAFRKKWG